MIMETKMDIALALGGGGSRGYAHIGVIRRLEEEGFRIRAVAGTSAGGIIAALFAAGRNLDELEEYLARLDQSRLFGRAAKEGPGLLGLSGAEKVLEELLGECTFDDLRIPCGVAATDVKSEREVVLNRGRVVDAVLATIALPGIFPPRQFKDHLLVDGGVIDPVPVTVARLLAPELPVVAVVLSPHVDANGGLIRLPLPVAIPTPIVERITHMRLTQAFNIFLQALDIGGNKLTELRLLVEEPEVIIRPDVGHIGLLDTVDVHKVVRLGEKAATAALPELRHITAWTSRMRRRFFQRRANVSVEAAHVES
jgi:NTE family protein